MRRANMSSQLQFEKNLSRRAFSVSAGLVMVGLAGCGNEPSTNVPQPSGGGAAAAKTDTRAQELKVAIIRLDSIDYGTEPGLMAIEEGIKQSLKTSQKYKIEELSAGGKLEDIPNLIDKAIAGGAVMLVTLLDTTTMIAFEKKPSIPIVFAMANNPYGLGIASSGPGRSENVTGVTLPHKLTLTVPIARGSLPKASRMAVAFDPANKISSVHKDDLLKCDWAKVEALEAPFKSGEDWKTYMEGLKKKDVSAIILTNGLGGRTADIIKAATAEKLPVFGTLGKQASEGAIFTREPSMRWTGFEVGRRIGRILGGEKASEISIVEGDQYVSVVNTKAAKDIGVTILPAIMRDIKDVSKPGQTEVGGAVQKK
jgi:ABC-type uncharacterized transport system substrate-binding protein